MLITTQSNNIQQIGTVRFNSSSNTEHEKSIAHILHLVDEHLVYSQNTATNELISSVFLPVEKLLLLEIQNASVLPNSLVIIMLIVVISTVIWESYVELEEDGLD